MKFYILSALLFFIGCAHSNQSYKGHGADSVAPELLEKFAPKAIPPQKLNRIESMLDVRSPEMGMLSPDGNNLYFGWEVTGNTQIWKISKDSRFPIQLTGGQDRTKLMDITPDGRYLVLTRDEKGNEYPYIYLQSTSGGSLRLIAGKEKVISNPQFITPDGRYLYFTMNDKGPTQHSLYRYDFKSGEKTEVFAGLEGYMFVTDHRGDELLLGNAKGNTQREFFTYNLKTKKLKPILGQDENEEYNVRFGRKKGDFLVLTNKFGEYRRLYLLRNGKFRSLTADMNYNVSDFNIDQNRKRILYTINRDGYSEVNAMNASTFKKMNIPFNRKGGVLHTSAGYTTPNSRYTVFGIEKAKSPASSYVYDWTTGKKSQWVYPSNPEIDTAKFTEPKLEYYTARDGTKIPMFVTRPEKCNRAANCPVIVHFHGGPEAQARPRFSPYIQLFTEEGFIFVEPNVRGSDGYSKTWLHSDNGPKRLNVITDIEDASVYIKKNWAVNGQAPRIGVYGGSYGGYSTNVAMTMFAGAFDAGVSVVGMSSLVTFLENTGPYRRHLRTSEYGDPEKDLQALKQLSPVTYLDKIQDPLLVIHGATDPRVPAGEAIQIYNAMEKKGLDGDLILFADEGHGVRKRKNRALYMGHTLNFFKKHLIK